MIWDDISLHRVRPVKTINKIPFVSTTLFTTNSHLSHPPDLPFPTPNSLTPANFDLIDAINPPPNTPIEYAFEFRLIFIERRDSQSLSLGEAPTPFPQILVPLVAPMTFDKHLFSPLKQDSLFHSIFPQCYYRKILEIVFNLPSNIPLCQLAR